MKKISTQISVIILAATIVTSELNAQANGCDSTSNVIIYSNYDGGILNINVDQNIPNLKIGVVSYEAVQINITGTYAANVTKVWYAGYNGTNDNCNLGVTNTTINGVPASVDTIQIYPAATYTDPNGSPNMVCSYQCVSGNSGGCNTPEQVVHFFLTKFGESTFRFHRTQYNCWPASAPVSGGGNCCLAPISMGTEEMQSSDAIAVFPNPAHDMLNVSFSSTESELATITLFDINGKAIRVQTVLLNSGENIFAMEAEGCSAGMYLLHIATSNGVSSQRVVIE